MTPSAQARSRARRQVLLQRRLLLDAARVERQALALPSRDAPQPPSAGTPSASPS